MEQPLNISIRNSSSGHIFKNLIPEVGLRGVGGGEGSTDNVTSKYKILLL